MADVLLCSTFEDNAEDFEYEFKDCNRIQKLTVKITVPLKVSVKEFANRLVIAHNLPCYLESELTDAIEKFTKNASRKLHDKMADLALDQVLDSAQMMNDYSSSWSNAFTQEHSKYCSINDVSEESAFAEMYHSLIHSPAFETLLQLENTYAFAVQDLLEQRENAIKAMEEIQHSEMDDIISRVGDTAIDKDVNNVAARHCEDLQMLQTKWSSELSQLQEMQRREYREWVTKVHEDAVRSNADDPSAALSSFKARSMSTTSVPASDVFENVQPEVKLEESFTIHLGAQMKTMHNLRLMVGDVLDLCRHKAAAGGSVLSQPQRIHTAMSLYSESLSGLILLVDNRLNTYSGVMKDFASICQQSTDFHFPDLDKQVCIIQQNIEGRRREKSVSSVHELVLGRRHQLAVSVASRSENNEALKTATLAAGDFYVTRHSNLAEVHVVFHLVVDDSLRDNNISARNPVIVGLRSALHTAVRHNITTITVPLLLFHEVTEEMTVSWCVKRAELVFKCVKGFMMECTNWSGAESLNVQFMAPKGISEDMFMTFSNMLPSIFRVSTPLDLKSNR